MEKTKKPLGRPITLTPEQREQRRVENNRKRNECHKRANFAAQKKNDKNYTKPVRVHKSFNDTLAALSTKTNMSVNKLFITAVEEKYNVTLMGDVDREEK